MNILVTGCAGAIGKYLVKKLLESSSQNKVFGVDKKDQIDKLLSSGFIANSSSRFTALPIDLMDVSEVGNLPDVDYVYHLAAINGTQLFYSIPWDVYVNSIQPTINLIDYYKNKSVKRFVYTSSSEVYASLTDLGINQIPTTESAVVGFSDVMNPRWSYGGAKLSGELALIAASQQFGVNFSIIRYHNVYGRNMGLNHVIPDFIDRGKNGVYRLNGANNIRSFIYIDDAIDATILVASSDKASNKIINIGSNEMITMRDLAQKIMNVFGWKGEIIEFSAPLGSTLSRCPDTSFLTKDLGFNQRYNLDMGLLQLLD
jgi:nucleoside-diphosphate-sugar epimerase